MMSKWQLNLLVNVEPNSRSYRYKQEILIGYAWRPTVSSAKREWSVQVLYWRHSLWTWYSTYFICYCTVLMAVLYPTLHNTWSATMFVNSNVLWLNHFSETESWVVSWWSIFQQLSLFYISIYFHSIRWRWKIRHS